MKQQRQKGQAMLLTVLFLSGAILSATAISGFLMFNQLKNLTDVSSSTKSVFGADAGIEWSLYKYFKYYTECYNTPPPPPACSNTIDDDLDTLTDFPADTDCTDANDLEEGVPVASNSPECDYKPVLENGVSIKISETKDPVSGEVNGAIATGSFGRTGRAFQIDFVGAATPLFPPPGP